VQGYTQRKNQSSHGGWDSVNGPVSPRRDILRDWTRTGNSTGENDECEDVDMFSKSENEKIVWILQGDNPD